MNKELRYFQQFSLPRAIMVILGIQQAFLERSASTLFRGQFQVEFDHKQNHIPMIGSGRELTLTGARFACSAVPPINKVIPMKLTFINEHQEEESIELKCRVCKTVLPPGRQRFRVGCEFLFESEDELNLLREFLNKLVDHVLKTRFPYSQEQQTEEVTWIEKTTRDLMYQEKAKALLKKKRSAFASTYEKLRAS